MKDQRLYESTVEIFTVVVVEMLYYSLNIFLAYDLNPFVMFVAYREFFSDEFRDLQTVNGWNSSDLI